MFRKNQLLIVSCFFIFYACKEDLTITFSESNIAVENNAIVEINIPIANGNEAVIELINSTIEAQVISTLRIGNSAAKNSESIEESIKTFNNEFNTFNNEFSDSQQLWEAQIDGDVMYQSSEIISIALTSYINTGSANGTLTILFLNFDAKTGKKIPNSHLFKDLKTFKQVANTYYNKTTASQDILFDSGKFELPENIGYTEEGLILLYNTYEMAPFATEIAEFTIPFSEVNSVLIFNGPQ